MINPAEYHRPITGTRLELFQNADEDFGITGSGLVLAAHEAGLSPIAQKGAKLRRLGRSASTNLFVIPLSEYDNAYLGVFRHQPDLGLCEKSEVHARAGINNEHKYRYICSVSEGPVVQENGYRNLAKMLKCIREIGPS